MRRRLSLRDGRGPRLGAVLVLVLGVSAAVSPAADPYPAAPPPDAASASPAVTAPPASMLVDAFDTAEGWTAHPADGVSLDIGSDPGWRGRSLRLDFRFLGGGGYAVVHKAFDLDLPENYAFSFRLRGKALPNHLEFKLIDDSGENVWWSVKRDLHFPGDWETVTIKKRQITFAWGPRGGGDIRHVAAIEFAVTAGSGGEGTVWLDDLELRPLPPPGAPLPPPAAVASSAASGPGASAVLDQDPVTAWEPAAGDSAPWVSLDFGGLREFGGLVVDWMRGRYAPDYAVDLSDDGAAWTTVRTVHDGNGGRDYLYLPESESRFLRLRILEPGPGRPPALAELTVEPLAWSATRNAFFGAVAADAPRGTYPRAFSGEQVYWTVAGVNAGHEAGLVSEDGAVEAVRGGFSVEPFLVLGDTLVTWAAVTAHRFLEDGVLPVPSVQWTAGQVVLTVTAYGTGPPDASSLVVRYRVENRGRRRVSGELALAVRPFQVNPPTQALNLTGGAVRIDSLQAWGDSVVVNGRLGVVSLTRPGAFGAAAFDAGDIVADFLARGRLPDRTRATDPFGAAGGAMVYPLSLRGRGHETVTLVLPQEPQSRVPRFMSSGEGEAWAATRKAAARDAWRDATERVRFQADAAPAKAALAVLEAQLGYILLERAGPALQPGTRSYARSWIRDGALTASALLRLGHPRAVRDYITWYAPHQYANGKIPCVVDARGADPVPEHDSTGEFLYLVAEYVRFTDDRDLAAALWPRIQGAVAYLDSLRREGRTAGNRTPDRIAFYGILPPSISHEGYSAKPMHSYWDDFFAYCGFREAVYLARYLGRDADAASFAAIRDTFSVDLAASVRAAMTQHGIDYVPGCADLGDFDATSTTIALAPTGGADLLPRAAVERTFQKYDAFFRAREAGAPWDAFTPYEIRNLGAFVRLGWRDRIQDLLTFFLACQRPPGWKAWPEVVGSDPRAPRFLGDLPHAWVASDYIRSVLDMIAYERSADHALVVAAGVPRSWLTGNGLRVSGLRTAYGTLDLDLRAGDRALRLRLSGDLRMPPGGIRFVPPLDGPPRAVIVNGAPAALGAGGEIPVDRLPALITIRSGK